MGDNRSTGGQEQNVVLCGANSYEQKYYFNRDFDRLPEEGKKELQILCVLFTEDVGGVLTLEFTPEGELDLKVQVDEGDYLFDEIGSGLKIRQYQREKRELFEGLEVFYKVFFLGQEDALEEDKALEEGPFSSRAQGDGQKGRMAGAGRPEESGEGKG